MDTTATEITIAFVGIGGVIAGALTTGGVQMLVATRERHRAARASARLFLLIYRDARTDLLEIVNGTRTRSVDWERLDTAWSEHRSTFALVVSTGDFLFIDHAVGKMRDIGRTWDEIVVHLEKAEEVAPLLTLTREAIMRLEPQAEEAFDAIHRAAFTRWEQINRQIVRTKWIRRLTNVPK